MNDLPKFKSVTTDDLPGEFMKCLQCGQVMAPEECEAHSCPEPEPTEYEVEMNELRKIIGDESVPAKDRIEAFEKFDKYAALMHEQRILRIAERFTLGLLRKMVQKEFESQIEYARREIKRQYELNDDRRKEGLTFKQRQEAFGKERIAMLERQEKRLIHEMQHFVVRPVAEWFSQVDYAIAKKRGMSWIIRINFGSVYTLPQSNHAKGKS